MSDRTALLNRVKDALKTPTAAIVRGETHVKPPEEHGQVEATNSALAAQVSENNADNWLPTVGTTFEERVALFAELSEKLTTRFFHVEHAVDAHEQIKSIAAEEGWNRVASHGSPLTDAACEALGLPVVSTDDGYDPDDLERCPASITACDALVAQTASILASTRSAGGRALSVLPEHHIVLATKDQMIADVPGAYRLLTERYGNNLPSWAGLITGPSRTGDIERVLVLGAHGPKRLTIILISEA